MSQVKGVKSLIVYKKAYKVAMDIFHISKKFPKEEVYSLTDQIRKSSRSVCANLSEGYSKRTYPKHFKSKLAIADGEAEETITWLDFAKDCEYISRENYDDFIKVYEEIGKMLGSMMSNPDKFKPRNQA